MFLFGLQKMRRGASALRWTPAKDPPSLIISVKVGHGQSSLEMLHQRDLISIQIVF